VKGLPWGRHYLMCPPDHFGVEYEINPWMHTEDAPDPDRARQQFDDLAPLVLALARIDNAHVEPIKIHDHDP